jgi:hypothetical protein
MQWPTPFRVTRDETTRTIFVFRIVFNYLTSAGYRILDLGDADVSNDALIYRVFGKFIPALLELHTDFID